MTQARRCRPGYISVNGIGLHYLEWGNAGPQVLVLHGATSMAINHTLFVESLFPNCHVFAMDHRGHGHSSHASSYTLDDFAKDTALFMEKLRIKDPLVLGHSLGGAISMKLFGNYNIPIRKLVLKDIGPEILWSAKPASHTRPISWDCYEAAYEHFANSPQGLGDTAAFIANNLKWDQNGSLSVRYDPEFNRVLRGWDMWAEVSKIHVPTLIPHGEMSDILPAETADRMVEVMPNAELVEFPNCSHLLEWEEPERFMEIIRNFTGDEFH